MFDVIFDTRLIVPPIKNANYENLKEFAEKLGDWGKLLEEPWVKIYTNHVFETFEKIGFSDYYTEIEKLFLNNGVAYNYSYRDISKLIGEIVQRSKDFEDLVCIGIECDLEEIIPDIISNSLLPELERELAKTIIILDLFKSQCNKEKENERFCLVVKPWQGSKKVKVRATITDFVSLEKELEIPLPGIFSIKTCMEFRDVMKILPNEIICELWQKAKDKSGLILPTSLAVDKERYIRNKGPLKKDKKTYRFYKQFYDSQQKKEIMGDFDLINQTLTTLRRIIEGHEKKWQIEWEGSQLVRDRDGAKAYRASIKFQYKNIHFWQCLDGSIEFAIVAPHDQIFIQSKPEQYIPFDDSG